VTFLSWEVSVGPALH